MAAKAIEDIFAALDQAFSGQKEYDEVLMELGLHTAQVRKQWPSLYAALSKTLDIASAKTDSGIASELTKLKALLESYSYAAGSVPNTSGIVPTAEAISQYFVTYSWNDWAQKCHTLGTGEIALVRWDVPNVPQPEVGKSITMKSETRRTRFTVKQ